MVYIYLSDIVSFLVISLELLEWNNSRTHKTSAII